MKEGWKPITPERMHELMMGILGGEPIVSPVPRAGCVEGAIGNSVLAASLSQAAEEPDALHVAAYLLRSLARNHCYTDGNKRIAWLACLDVLAEHAVATIDADEDAAAEVVEDVAKGRMSVGDLIRWLESGLVPIESD